MKISSIIALSAALFVSATAVGKETDHINFNNDDTLHGEFKGLTSSGKIIWANDSAEQNIAFKLKTIRKIVLNEGRLTQPFTHTGYLTLTNEDTIPGNIIKITKDHIVIDTDYAGEIRIDRNKVKNISITPHGKKIIYRGPFTSDDWKATTFLRESQLTEMKKKKSTNLVAWKFNSFSWVNHKLPGGIFYTKPLPAKFRLSYAANSDSGTTPYIIIGADKKRPPETSKEGKEIKTSATTQSITNETTGTCLTIKPNTRYASMTFNGFTKEGKPFTTTIPNMTKSTGSYNNPSQFSTHYDLRVDRTKNIIILYANGNLVARWDTSSISEQLKGNSFGYLTKYTSRKKSIISDIVISSWNGIVDPAITLENDDVDIVMLSNNTDRFSGQVLQIKDNNLELKGPYAELAIPLEQVQLINFARKNLTNLPEKSDEQVTIRFHGTGRITGSLSRGPEGSVILDTKALGKLTLKHKFITSIEFVDMQFAYELSR